MGKAPDQPPPEKKKSVRMPGYWFVFADAVIAVNRQRDPLNPMTQALTSLWQDQLCFEYARRVGLTGGGVVHGQMASTLRLPRRKGSG